MSTIADLPAGWIRLADPGATRWRLARGGVVEAEALFRGPGSSYAEFLYAVGGKEETISYPGGSQSVTRIVPLKFPSASTLFDNVYANGVEIEASGLPSEDDAEQVAYEWAVARVTFSSESFYDFGSDHPLLSYSFTGNADMISQPGTAYKFPSDGLKLSQDVGALVPWRDFSITLHNLQSLDETIYDDLCGRVNSDVFYHPSGVQYAAGYIQYLGPSGGYSTTIGNQKSFTITHRFKWRRIKHNAVARPDGGGFEEPVVDDMAGTTKILPAANLNQIYDV